MKGLKKVILFTLIASALATSFAACDTAPAESSGETGGNSTSTDSGTDSSDAGSSNVSAKGVLPIVDEKVTLTAFMTQSANIIDYEENDFTIYLEEQTNVHVDWQLSPEGDAATKVNLLLASQQDLPDVFIGGNGMSKAVVAEYGAKGVFIPYNNYLEEHSEYLAPILEQHPEVTNVLQAEDGNYYHFTKFLFSEPNSTSRRVWVNEEWLDNVGMDMPTTIDEFTAVLTAFKEQDANGNGDATDEIPFMGATTGWNARVHEFILGSFLPYSGNYMIEDGVIKAAYTDERYKEGITYLASLVADGLLDPTTFTQDAAQMKQLVEGEGASRLGVFPGGTLNTGANQGSEKFNQYTHMNPLEGPDGTQYAFYNPYGQYGGVNAIITNTCEDPLLAFKWFDYMYSEDISMRARFGAPDVHHIRYDEDSGVMGVDGEPAMFETIEVVWGEPVDMHWSEVGPSYNYFDNKGARLPEGQYDMQTHLWEVTADSTPYAVPTENVLPSYMYSPEDSERISEIEVTLNAFITEQMTKFITGAIDIEADWDAYIEELEKIGYQEVIDIHQARYDELNS